MSSQFGSVCHWHSLGRAAEESEDDPVNNSGSDDDDDLDELITKTPTLNRKKTKQQEPGTVVSKSTSTTARSSTSSPKSPTSDISDSEDSTSKMATNKRKNAPKAAKQQPAAKVQQELEAKHKKELDEVKGQLDELEEVYQKLFDSNEQDVKDYNDLLKKYKNLKVQFADLQASYKKILADSAGTSKKDDDKNPAMIREINSIVKRIMWRTNKFLGSDEQLLEVSTEVLDELGLDSCTHVAGESRERYQEVEVNRNEWLLLYSTNVREAFNEQRSYVQSEMKKIALAYQLNDETNFKDLPTFEEMLPIVRREIMTDDSDTTSRNQELLDFWMELLGACAGTTYYGKKQRRTVCVSTAITSKEGKVAVPPSTEAMALVMYDNCHSKWVEMHKYKEVENNKGDVPKYSKKNVKTHRFKAKYSDSCSGQAPYGGWSSAGIIKFNEMKKMIKDNRANESARIQLAEEAAVQRFHDREVEERKQKMALNNQAIPADDAAILPAKKRRKKTKAPVVLTENDED